MRKIAAATILSILSNTALSQESNLPGSASLGAARYEDNNVDSNIVSASISKTFAITEGQGWETSSTLSGTKKYILFKEPADLLQKQLKGKTRIEEDTVSGTITQGFGIGHTVGLLAGTNKSPLSKSNFIGLRVGLWWLEETLQSVVEHRKNDLEQAVLDFVDTDGKRVITPEDLDGRNTSLTLTHFTTPSTILRSAYSYTSRSDRPAAWSASGEIRQYIETTSSAVHFAGTHYENIGEIEARTTFGSVISNTLRAEWHQKVFEKSAAALGYRYYLEKEDPRAFDAQDNQVGTDSVFASYRWRFDDVAWTADSSELSVFFNSFRANSGIDGLLVGSSLSYTF
jgi:hypothetical protein